MTDDLERLKRLMDQATPAPDPAKKAAHLALSHEAFARAQETADAARHSSDRRKGGFINGVASMFAHLTTRGALAASTALVALGLVIALPQLTELPLPERTGRSAAPVAEPATPAPRARQSEEETAETLAPAANPVGKPQAATPRNPSVSLAEADSASEGFAASQGLSKRTAPADIPQAQPAPMDQGMLHILPDTEAYPEADPNPLKRVAQEPVSTFSIDVDTASFAVIRSSIIRGQLPPVGAVRIEEMINYFPYDHPAPQTGEAPFRPTITLMPTPWNSGTELVHIAIQGRQAPKERPPLNLVFLIDTSGSMQGPDKLPLLKQSLALMLPRLTGQDSIAIVAYAGHAGQVLAPTPVSDRTTILAALETLSAGGATGGQAGLEQAYALAESMAGEGEVSRVILATDGDFNVGLSDPQALARYIAEKRAGGTYLSVLGFGRGNLDDATMQALAQNGNGQAAYIDTLSEAQKVLVDQLSGALFPIADDVKIQVEFNPAQIAEYRLIGYETRVLRREDFNNDKVDAGDIGAGHSVTALYEITPVGSPARLTDPLRYGAAAPVADPGAELGYLKLRYKEPGATESRLIEAPILPGMGPADDDARFATAIAGFGQLLGESRFLGDWGYDDAIALANGARGADPFGYRAEAIRLMRLAKSLAR